MLNMLVPVVEALRFSLLSVMLVIVVLLIDYFLHINFTCIPISMSFLNCLFFKELPFFDSEF